MDWNLLKKYSIELVIVLLLIIAIINASFHTISIPLSLNQLWIYAYMFIYLLFFLLHKDRESSLLKQLKFFVYSLAIAAACNLLLLLIPGIGSLFPPMNMIYATYGHNHLSTALILFYPLVFFWAFKQDHLSKFWIVMFSLFTGSLLFNFGRVNTLLMVSQLVIFLFSLKISTSKIKEERSAAVLALSGIILAALSIFLLGLLRCPGFIQTFTVMMNRSFACQKKVSEEPRVFYWQQAINSIKQHPFVGSGPGTFSLISEKFRQIPTVKTLYTHNEYLSVFAELGFLSGILFLILLFVPIIGFVRSIAMNFDKYIESIYFYVFIGYISILTIFFFDYSLQFLPIQILFTAVLGLLLKKFNLSFDYKKYLSRPKILIQVAKIVYLLSIIFFSCFIVGKILTSYSNNPNLKILFEPKLTNSIQFLRSIGESNRLVTLLFKNYSSWAYLYNPEMMRDSNPWLYITNLAASSGSEVNLDSYDFAHKLLMKAREEHEYDYYQLAQRLSLAAHSSVEKLLAVGNVIVAHEYYVIAAKLDPWSIHSHRLPIAELDPTHDDCSFLNEMLDFPIEPFGDQREQAAWGYINCAMSEVSKYSIDKRAIFAKKAVKMADWSANFLPKEYLIN